MLDERSVYRFARLARALNCLSEDIIIWLVFLLRWKVIVPSGGHVFNGAWRFSCFKPEPTTATVVESPKIGHVIFRNKVNTDSGNCLQAHRVVDSISII